MADYAALMRPTKFLRTPLPLDDQNLKFVQLGGNGSFRFVMAGLVPAIHVLGATKVGRGCPGQAGTSPGMTDMMARSSGGFPVGMSVNGGLRCAHPRYGLIGRGGRRVQSQSCRAQ